MAQNLQEDGADREPPRSEKPERDAIARARSKRPNRKSQQDDKPFPIIRKPVPVSKSGPLRAPKPGSPVKPPSVLTNRVPPIQPDVDLHLTELTGDSANLDFLDLDEGNSWVNQSGADGDQQFYQELNARESRRPQMWLLGIAALLAAGLGYFLYPHWQARQSTASLEETDMPAAVQLAESERAESERADSVLAETSAGEADNPVVLPEQDAPDLSSPTNVVNEFEAARPLNVRFREQLARLESLVAEGEIAQAEEVLNGMDRTLYGYGAPEFSLIEARIEAAKPEIVQRETERAAAEGEADAPADLQAAELLAQEQAELEAQRLAQEQAARELAEQQEAERLAREQAELEQQRLALEQAARELAEQEEAERLAQEQAELEAQRLAREQEARELAERQEAERLAQEQAARELAERQEAERLAREQAELEAQRLAQEQAARELAEQQEAERLAREQAELEAQRLAQEQAATALAEQQEAERLAQEQAEQLLAAERSFQDRILRRQELERVAALAEQTRADRATQELARQEQLLRAQQALQPEDSSQIALIQAAPEPVKPVISSIQAVDPVIESPVPQSISDEELQSVYQRFDQLQNAIRDRDIQAVIKLTDRSVVKIQQFQQIFLNNVSIEARIKNVSTRDARGEVEGTLVITRLERADGVVTGPPADLSSVRLTSKRNEDGWSAIQW